MNRKRKIVTLIATMSVFTAMIVTIAVTNNKGNLLTKSADSNYTLTLNESNAYTGTTSKTTKSLSTDSGNYHVNFEYYGCSSYSNGHSQISSSGYIRNSDHILSILTFKVNYTGSDLQVRTSYDGVNWGTYFDVTSGVPVSLESKPYYIEMKPKSGTTYLASAEYQYSCVENQDIPAAGFEKISSVDQLDVGKKVIIFGNKDDSNGIGLNETVYSKYYLTGIQGTVTNNYLNDVTTKDYTIYTVGKSGDKYTFISSTNQYLSSTNDGTHYNVKPSKTLDNAAKWSISTRTNGFNVLSGIDVYLKATLYNSKTPEFTGDSGTSTDYPINFYVETSGLPKDPISISVSDTGTYNENSIYNGSNLKVNVNYSDGLSKQVTTGYTYVVTDPSGKVVPQGNKLGGVGNFTVTVTYGDFTNATEISVSRDVKLTGAEIRISKTEYTTADTIASALENVTGDLHYNYSDEDKYDLTYSELTSSYGFSGQLELNSASKPLTGKFTDEGTYTLSITNGTITSNEVTLTVTKAVSTAWELVSDASTLMAGDTIVIGESSKGYSAGDITSQYMSAISTSFSNCKIEDLPESTVKLTLGGSSGAWTLANQDGQLLGATAVKKLAWNDGTKTWSISISSDAATIQNGTDSYGRFLFNANSEQERFTTYTSSVSATMILPQIYRGAKGEPIYATDISLNKTAVTLTAGESETLTVTFDPSNTNKKDIDWSSSNNLVATVIAGTITAVSAGSATITASYTKKDGTKINRTCSVTVSAVAVTSVSLDKTAVTLNEGETTTLKETVLPTNAANKNVTWTSSNSDAATVSSTGLVTAVKEGEATITVKTVDGNKTATCEVTVKKAGGGEDDSVSITPADIETAYSEDATCTVESTLGTSYTFNTYKVANFSTNIQFKANEGYVSNVDSMTIQSIELVTKSGSGFSGTLYWGTSIDPTTNGVSVSDGNTYTNPGSYDYFKLHKNSKNAGYLAEIIIKLGKVEGIDPTAISIPSTASVGVNGTTTLDVTYTPSNANQHKGITWTSSDASVATVNASTGLITGVKAGTATITAKSELYPTVASKSCTLTVTEEQIDKWTIMLYMCGADLESDYGQASGDIKEILATTGQPDDVNVIIETGGSNSWSLGSSYIEGATSIPSDKLGRWHVANKKLVFDTSLTYASMGASSTYESFLNWGLNSYPAEKTAVVLWNHGGGLDGVCFDEKKGDDALLNSEMKTAHKNAIGSKKLEFIGYDACLMECADIADFNSTYFKYQVASQESENGSGWYYTGWIDNVYKYDTTFNVCKEICDTFISTQGSKSDQTLSTLDLSYASAFKDAWNAYASALSTKFKSSSVNKNNFMSWAKSNIKNYSEEDYCGYGQFDVIDWMNKIANNTSYNPGGTYKSDVTNVLNNYIAYNKVGTGAGNSNGLCVVYKCARYVDYSSGEYAFSSWATFNSSYGY